MHELLEVITRKYGIELPTSVERVTEGQLSENYILTDGGHRYFLKKYRYPDIAKIQQIHEAKHFFAAGDIPVILSLRSKEGNTYFEQGAGHYALFPFIAGITLPRGNFPSRAMVSMGRMLGKIHLHGAKSTVQLEHKPEKSSSMDAEKVAEILSHIREKKEKTDFDLLAERTLLIKREIVRQQGIVTAKDLGLARDHLIHGDYLDHNLFFDETDNVSHVFDFEKARYAPRSFELFRSMLTGLIHEDNIQDELWKAKLYVDVYRDVYPIASDELALGLKLFSAHCFQSIWVESEHYLKNNSRVDIFLRSSLDRVLYLRDNQDQFIASL